MKSKTFWLFLVFLTLGWSLWETYPPTGRDLVQVFEQRAVGRDATFDAIVQRARELEQANPGRAYAHLLEATGTNHLASYFPMFNVADEPDPQVAILHRLQREASGKIKLGLDLRGGTSFLVAMDTNQFTSASQAESALDQAVEVLRKRVDRFGVAEPIIQPAGANRILIQLPGLSEQEKASAKTQIEKAAFLEFRLVHERSEEMIRRGIPAVGYTNMVMRSRARDGTVRLERFLVKRAPEKGLTGKDVEKAGVYFSDLTNEPRIHVTFTGHGAQLFAEITRENVGRQLAIILDGELYSAPLIREPILAGSCEISGGFTVAEAFELANVLVNPLEAPVTIEEERGVDPSLGRDSIRSGIKATLIGAITVCLFMLGYYLVAGLVANIALVMNIIILIGVMCYREFTFTLPGIAGVVLTLGMAVDANVLIFERIREELRAGKSMRGALEHGYRRAFGTIFDTNLTTLIASIILIFFGTGPVKGFGQTLTIGVSASMFTALVVTRLIFEWSLARGWLRQMKMLSFIGETKIDFLRYAKPAFAVSWILILGGLGYGLARGHDVLGVDFAGGDQLTLRYNPAHEVPVDALRNSITALNLGDAMIQYQRDPDTGTKSLQLITGFETGERAEKALREAFPDAEFQRVQMDTVGPSVGREIQLSALGASLIAMFAILIYVAFRYEFSFAVGAVIAILHDILMTMGWFFLSGRELSAPIVAAVLTIMGFSINDTIVVFDRIREDLRLGVRGSFKQLINQALNQTLSRTLITSGTTLLATLSLYLFGGGVINDFAFTFLVGIITGTYSTIYIASAIVLWWHRGERPKAATQVVMDTAMPAGA